ncbi:GMP synthase [Caldivirga maquilingensis]|uniref:GMP synthase (glutamine-hydrolyzing) n=1 Tax=Caldivirga maquilingensis (strain ATCC 700844 / DSM 13496 / JCM 10307 / IC-167) TaxID=397948 RepID=A8ME23_CALMQ|nr:GMP synthase [Caldivirga maquilingensis]ABW02029.1 GMP synthase domain protein [Caldivirga maquilingensis IC-167]
MFTPEEFIRTITGEVRKLEVKCAVAAVSGGVDSTTSAVVARLALGDRLIPVLFDTGFMRLNETSEIINSLTELLPIRLIDVKDEFYRAMINLSDAEEKRLTFRNVFYNALSRVVKDNDCDWVVQGTIAPDWIETTGGIKTQHNVLAQLGIETDKVYGFKLLEPLKDLYKDQVRALARYLKIPSAITERQPFPGPGLSIRAVGKLTMEKLEVTRWSTRVVEEGLSGLGLSQWFAAVWEDDRVTDEELSSVIRGMGENLTVDVFSVKGTGVKGDSREYGRVVLVRGKLSNWSNAFTLYSKLTYGTNVTHVIYELARRRPSGGYFVAVRAVVTDDYMTANVPTLNEQLLRNIANELMRSELISAVGIDVTPKPPATIEFE